MGRVVVHYFRATCFGDPCGPWRDTLRQTFEDLEHQGLGCRDDYGRFYVTVPGGYTRMSEWADFDEAMQLTFARRARLHGQQPKTLPRQVISRDARHSLNRVPIAPARSRTA